MRQPSSHHVGRDGEKMCAILPSGALYLDLTKKNFVDKCGRLQRVAAAFLVHIARCYAAQFGGAYGYYSSFLPPMRRNDEAIEAARTLLSQYPLDNIANGNLGSVFVYRHR
jgi:hypothetical protein